MWGSGFDDGTGSIGADIHLVAPPVASAADVHLVAPPPAAPAAPVAPSAPAAPAPPPAAGAAAPPPQPGLGYSWEYAPSARAKCAGACKGKIDKGAVRLCNESEGNGDFNRKQYRKLGCITKIVFGNIIKKVGSVENVAGFDQLKPEDQAAIKDAAAAAAAPAAKQPAKKKAKANDGAGSSSDPPAAAGDDPHSQQGRL